MPSKTFHLAQDKQDSISISWKGVWKQVSITYNGQEVGSFNNQKELKTGNEFQLDAERKLSVKLSGQLFPELELLVNGQAIAGSPTDPNVQLKQVFNFSLGIGGLSLVVGLIAELFVIDFLLNIGIGLGSIIYGGLIILLAFGVKRKSIIALALIVGLIGLEIVGSVWIAAESQVNPTSGIVIKTFFLIFLFKGFGAIKKLKKTE